MAGGGEDELASDKLLSDLFAEKPKLPKGAAKNAAAAAAEKEQQAREEVATKAASQGLQRVLAPRRAQNIEIMLVGPPCVFIHLSIC